MVHNMTDSDGFEVVKSKRFSKNKITKIPSNNLAFQREVLIANVSKTRQSISSAAQDLRGSCYLEDVFRTVSNHLDCNSVVEIVCFGLGHIGECKISQYQLALLLCLKDKYTPKKVLAHDPVFSRSECDILKLLDVEVIEKNDEGIYPVSSEGVTLLFFPHCPKQLTNNFLWSNWGLNLRNCVLICNSFSSLLENQPSRITSESVPFIHKIFSYTRETVLCNTFKFTDIFNDLSVHSFPKNKLISLDTKFWIRGDKPNYNSTEEFITSLMIEKLNL